MALFALGLILCDVEAVFAAEGEGDSSGVAVDDDKEYMQQQGMEGLFKKKKKKDPRAPKTWQVALGLGAFPVTIIALKKL